MMQYSCENGTGYRVNHFNRRTSEIEISGSERDFLDGICGK
jgi:hypothetical protein